ncbi:MAG TPA: hypothetical protein VHP83_22630 [Aggregatilineaceae bacterium]|nr:hypothetical protein [Aggregatilineaceae bacterium]
MKFQVTQVEARYTLDGWPIPQSLLWESETLRIIDVGRRWKADDGIHILARVPDQRVFELHTNGSLWRARLVAEPPRSV